MDEWLAYALKYIKDHPEQRQGQAYYNSLHAHRPDIAYSLTGTVFDPFYNNARLPAFFEKVEELWSN